MTRINLVDPALLADQHLVAEHKETWQAMAFLAPQDPGRARARQQWRIPKRYVLGPGHVKFFADKLDYVRWRDNLVVQEMLLRNYQPTTVLAAPDRVPWWPSRDEVEVNLDRLISRLRSMVPGPRYCVAYEHPEAAVERLVYGVAQSNGTRCLGCGAQLPESRCRQGLIRCSACQAAWTAA